MNTVADGNRQREPSERHMKRVLLMALTNKFPENDEMEGRSYGELRREVFDKAREEGISPARFSGRIKRTPRMVKTDTADGTRQKQEEYATAAEAVVRDQDAYEDGRCGRLVYAATTGKVMTDGEYGERLAEAGGERIFLSRMMDEARLVFDNPGQVADTVATILDRNTSPTFAESLKEHVRARVSNVWASEEDTATEIPRPDKLRDTVEIPVQNIITTVALDDSGLTLTYSDRTKEFTPYGPDDKHPDVTESTLPGRLRQVLPEIARRMVHTDVRGYGGGGLGTTENWWTKTLMDGTHLDVKGERAVRLFRETCKSMGIEDQMERR
ncbi:MAG: hypothetical protein ABIH11_07560 [Candidatus Altiarchaeota archaeon]